MDKLSVKPHYDFSQGKRGAVVSSEGKELINIRLDSKVINWFKSRVIEASGGSYQNDINDALLKHISVGDLLKDLIEKERVEIADEHKFLSELIATSVSGSKAESIFGMMSFIDGKRDFLRGLEKAYELIIKTLQVNA